MTPHLTRGVKRTLGVIALFWVVGWGGTAYLANNTIRHSHEQIICLRSEGRPFSPSMNRPFTLA